MVFDKVSKKKAIDCTPAAAKIEVSVQVFVDPVSKQKSYFSTDGYDPNATDDVHKCSDTPPLVNTIDVTKTGTTYKITVNVTQGVGGHALQSVDVSVGGNSVGSIPASGSGSYSLTYMPTSSVSQTVSATVTDTALYTSAAYSINQTFN